MKKFVLFILILFLSLIKSQGQIYIADSCRITFFSSTSMEDIEAINTISKPIMSEATRDIQISISNADFNFESRLMKEHYNEDYMETAKYPKTIFKGKVNEQVDYTKDGVNQVTVTGTIDMHGVQKIIIIPGTIIIKNGVIFILGKFDVKMADYNIKVPSVLGNNLADHVAVTLSATMKPYIIK